MGRVEGKVAFVTGAARGQGRSHAVRLARGGRRHHRRRHLRADRRRSAYAMATPEDLDETVRRSRSSTGGSSPRRPTCGTAPRCRPRSTRASRELGPARRRRRQRRHRLDACRPADELTDERLAGHDRHQPHRRLAHRRGRAMPHLIEQRRRRRRSSLTSSTAGHARACRTSRHYVAAKHGVVGLMRALANELAPHRIRVNTVHPTGVATPMVSQRARRPASSLTERDPETLGARCP